MKKLLIILTIILSGCFTRIPSRNFVLLNNNYLTKDSVVTDIYKSFKLLNIDSIPLEDWMLHQGYEGYGYFIERYTTQVSHDIKTQYYMIFTTYYKQDTASYNYKIKCNTKDESIWRDK